MESVHMPRPPGDDDSFNVRETGIARKALLGVVWSSAVFSIVACAIGIPTSKSANAYLLQYLVNDPEHSQPVRGTTIAYATVHGIAVAVGVFIFIVDSFLLVYSALQSERLRVGIQMALGLLEACLWNAFGTEVAKNAFGAMRPYFNTVCLGAAWPTQFPWNSTTCTGPAAAVEDARKSFPSGHTSEAACIAVYTTCWLLWHFYRLFRNSGSKPVREIISFFSVLLLIPMLLPFWVGSSRFHDHAHLLSGVIGGFLTGAVVGLIVFMRTLFVSLPQK